jgi:hypothetical protein
MVRAHSCLISTLTDSIDKCIIVPSLEGNLSYTITVAQDIETSDGSQKMAFDPPSSTQSFYVHAPRFSLPPGAVHSTYPPQGLGDHNNILPHIIFQDPHMPWENSGSPKQDAKDDESSVLPRNKVPWLALLTFTEDELTLLPSELKRKSENGLFPESMKIPPKTTQSPPPMTSPPTPPTVPGREQDKSVFSVKLTMGEYLEMGGGATPTVVTPIQDNKKEKIDQSTQVDVIFLQPSHVQDLFATYDADGARQPLPANGQTVTPDVSGYKFLAHVRNVNTKYIAGAGSDDDGLFSVVVARRSGPLNVPTPKPVIVHLVTLEGIEVADGQTPTVKFPMDPKKKVAFVSLYSWTYLCLPPEQVNFMDSMKHIGFDIEARTPESPAGKCWLRASDDVVANFEKTLPAPGADGNLPPPSAYTPQQKVAARLVDRLNDGYCLQRYRLQTGEETVSFYRGPLTPNYVSPIEDSWWPYQSNFSSDYQILDRQLGIMDISYSAAYQLGKTLGIANQSFAAALVRLRGVIQTMGRRGALKDLSPHLVKSKAEVLATLPKTIKALSSFANGSGANKPLKNASATSKTGPSNVTVEKALRQKHIDNAAKLLASAKAAASTPMPSPDDQVLIPWNDILVPNSTDWQIVQSWILDNLFFKNIPAHYLIPDPSYLPKETMRFFYVDNNWMDAFIDGALSLGNHLDREDDVVRQSFKNRLNDYFNSKYSDSHPDHPDLKYHPQNPCFGFFLRSAVVKAFPDLEIHAPWKSTDDTQGAREPTVRYEAIAPDTLLCLFDRMPGQDHWDSDWQITLSQPPHQQCFRIGRDAGLTATQLEVEFPAVYTDLNDRKTITDRYAPLRTVKWFKDRSDPTENDRGTVVNTNSTGIAVPRGIFDWNSRMIIPSAFAAASQTIISEDMIDPPAGKPDSTEYYSEQTATSAMTGNVLTSFISKIKIEVPVSTSSTQPPDYTRNPRQIRVPAPIIDPNTLPALPMDTDDQPGNDPLPNPPVKPSASTTSPVYRLPGPPAGFDPNTAKPNIPLAQCVMPALPPGDTITELNEAQFEAVIFPLVVAAPGFPRPVPPALARPFVTLSIPAAGSAADHPIDLVVSLTRRTNGDTKHKLQLFSLRVRLTVGSGLTDLLGSDAVSSARMLHNARFNVHTARITLTDPDTGKVQQYLEFTVIPRAASSLVPLAAVQDLSFVIGQVHVSKKAGRGLANVWEFWRWQNGNVKTAGYKLLDKGSEIILMKREAAAAQ